MLLIHLQKPQKLIFFFRIRRRGNQKEKNIYLIWPSKYPDDYYWWNSAFRFGPFISSEIRYSPLKGKLNYAFNFQCSTNDIYIASYGFNRSWLYLHDIFVYGLGTKISRKKVKPLHRILPVN